MKPKIFGSALTAGLLLGSGLAYAQAVIEITPDQERVVYDGIMTRSTVGVAPSADVRFVVGAEVPTNVELYDVPATVEVAPVRSYRYTTWGNRVVLVDPGTRRVIRIIER